MYPPSYCFPQLLGCPKGVYVRPFPFGVAMPFLSSDRFHVGFYFVYVQLLPALSLSPNLR